ncbi:MAG: hypothetical protein HYR88_16375 [Verrucomicrobia bacterium]|nr:hypothetical protein [Verrucomicrobiota bacterium]MBI3871134.1 hypothetical protein [Verrucomicrobiota bacterium]
MSLETLYQRLLRVARANPPSERVPYAFEKRVMARLILARAQALDPWAQISQGLWRAVIPCFAFTVMLFCWHLTQATPGGSAGESGLGAVDDLEVAVVDSIDLNDSVEDGL